MASTSSFKLARFNPNQSNIRRDFFTKNINPSLKFDEEHETKSDEHFDPTSNYNYDILADLTALKNNQFLKDTFNNSKGVLEAVKLLKLWLLKRGLNTVNLTEKYIFFLKI